MIHSLRYSLLLGTAALLVSAPALKADKPAETTTPPVAIPADAPKGAECKKAAEKKCDDAKKKAECKKAGECKKAATCKKAVTCKKDAEAQAACTAADAKKAKCKASEAKKAGTCSLKDGKCKEEAGKGSEQGQAMRKKHSKKWWKFWSKETPAE